MLNPDHPSWTPQGLQILERACEQHGLEAWRALRKISLFPGQLSGLLPWMKGLGETFRLPRVFEIFPHEGRVRFVEYPDPEHDGWFENGAVRIVARAGAVAVTASADHRASFRGLAKYRQWTPLDALYFFGYALSHYHTLPFTLSDARLLRVDEACHRGDSDVLHVELPAELATHGRRQSFYFDRCGRLIRHDYHAEIVGSWARAAHFWRRQTVVKGFSIALDRHVFARLGSWPCPVTALHATFVGAGVD